MNDLAARDPEHIRVHWMSLGELSRLIETFRREGVTQAVMAGQVKHKQIFSSIRPDWRLAKLLLNLRTRSTDMLLGAVAKVLADEGITLVSSTSYLEPMLAPAGVLTARAPDETERSDIDYGLQVARGIAGFDLGQTVVIAAGACVAVEAMEGTDAMLRRAATLVNGKPLRLVKVSRRRGHLLFDVPVAGPGTIKVMQETGATVLAVDAGRTLLLDRDEMLGLANECGIAIAGYDLAANERE
jgi:UDP-2,3-diacylglucosamine hydrolase